MHFATQGGRIAGGIQTMNEGRIQRRQAVVILKGSNFRRQPGTHHANPGWRTNWAVAISIGKMRPGILQAIQMRSARGNPELSQVDKRIVLIGENKNDIRLLAHYIIWQ